MSVTAGTRQKKYSKSFMASPNAARRRVCVRFTIIDGARFIASSRPSIAQFQVTCLQSTLPIVITLVGFTMSVAYMPTARAEPLVLVMALNWTWGPEPNSVLFFLMRRFRAMVS